MCFRARLPISTALKDADRVPDSNIRSAYRNMHSYLYARTPQSVKIKTTKKIANLFFSTALTIAHSKPQQTPRKQIQNRLAMFSEI